jgi:hypothetical protein
MNTALETRLRRLSRLFAERLLRKRHLRKALPYPFVEAAICP